MWTGQPRTDKLATGGDGMAANRTTADGTARDSHHDRLFNDEPCKEKLFCNSHGRDGRGLNSRERTGWLQTGQGPPRMEPGQPQAEQPPTGRQETAAATSHLTDAIISTAAVGAAAAEGATATVGGAKTDGPLQIAPSAAVLLPFTADLSICRSRPDAPNRCHRRPCFGCPIAAVPDETVLMLLSGYIRHDAHPIATTR